MNEDQYLNKIEIFLKDNGFKTWRETVPKECKNWETPFRIDLIFYRKDTGYIAVEAKSVRSMRQGSIIAKALEQIKKYRDLTYFSNIKIKRWCITLQCTHKNEPAFFNDSLIIFIKTLLNYYGVDFLEYKEYKNKTYNKIAINSCAKNALHIKNGERSSISKWFRGP